MTVFLFNFLSILLATYLYNYIVINMIIPVKVTLPLNQAYTLAVIY